MPKGERRSDPVTLGSLQSAKAHSLATRQQAKQGSEAATTIARQQRQQKGRDKPGARQGQRPNVRNERWDRMALCPFGKSKAGATSQEQGRPTILQQDFPHKNPTMLGKMLRKTNQTLVLETETRPQTRPKRGPNEVQTRFKRGPKAATSPGGPAEAHLLTWESTQCKCTRNNANASVKLLWKKTVRRMGVFCL